MEGTHLGWPKKNQPPILGPWLASYNSPCIAFVETPVKVIKMPSSIPYVKHSTNIWIEVELLYFTTCIFASSNPKSLA